MSPNLPRGHSLQGTRGAPVTAFGYDEAASRESRLLYVGVTRARGELTITHSGDLTPLLPPPGSGLYQVIA
jgi:hypothetical protein